MIHVCDYEGPEEYLGPANTDAGESTSRGGSKQNQRKALTYAIDDCS